MVNTDNGVIVNLDEIRSLTEATHLKEAEIKDIRSNISLSVEQRNRRVAAALSVLATLQKKLKRAQKIETDFGAFSRDDLDLWTAFLAKYDYHYVQASHRYVIFNPDGTTTTLLPAALHAMHVELSSEEDGQLLKAAMSSGHRLWQSVTATFRPTGDTVLNLLRRDHWVKPEPGEPHRLFDILLTSLGGGRQENIDHLERCIVWKYLHPEDPRLPVPVIFGEGEVGKNLIFEEVFATLVGENQSKVLEVDNVLGNFNGMIVGLTFAMINEAVRDSINMERFKARTHAKRLPINEKYGLQGMADATCWQWCGGNGLTAAIQLANDRSDRRWSIIRIPPGKNLMWWIKEREGLANEIAASEWFETHSHHLSDRTQVAHWLHHLMTKWADAKFRPHALHGADFRWLAKQQSKAWEEVAEAVFSDPEFTHIEVPLFYNMFKWYCREYHPASRFIIKKADFVLHIEQWLERNCPQIAKRKCDIQATKGIVKAYDFFVAQTTKPPLKDNANAYEIQDNFERVVGYVIPGLTHSSL